MRYDLNLPGFEGRGLSLDTGPMLGNPTLLIDGRPAPQPARGEYLLRRNDGLDVKATVLPSRFADPVPTVVIDGEPIRVAEPLRWYDWLWMGLPVLLVLIGGGFGLVVGLLAVIPSAQVMRTQSSLVGRYGLSGLVSVAAVAFFFAARGVLQYLGWWQ